MQRIIRWKLSDKEPRSNFDTYIDKLKSEGEEIESIVEEGNIILVTLK